MEMTGKSQTEAVSVLRNTKLGSTVAIVVSRQVTEEDDQFAVPRELVRSVLPVLITRQIEMIILLRFCPGLNRAPMKSQNELSELGFS